ncbi:putative rna polymerase ii mediator complex subunit protein [Zalerion maritima]|uniref:Mediator of RNA polymerase II transcription subunit 18 n=1 Tax=Zalerion maritima TaxID=339359 RepID=A0AAD5WNP9_9PEZI|nr:putative rna polymerase ii mediator complex subunit protein [Zalerion maritima]
MHELFIAASVEGRDFASACAVLQGLTGGTAKHELHRVLFYQGPHQPKGFKAPTGVGQWQASYQELHRSTLKQGFVVRASWDVSDTAAHFGPDTQAANLDATPATLLWTDMPDPTTQPILQRKMVEIPDQPNLTKVLANNDYSFKNEALEETYTYYRDTIEFSLTRWRTVPLAMDEAGNRLGSPQERLSAPFDEAYYHALDPTGRWQLFVRAYVSDTDPDGMKRMHEYMKKAHEELMDIKSELEGVFEFPAWDRKCWDSRIAVQVSNMPAPLPQVQSARGGGFS